MQSLRPCDSCQKRSNCFPERWCGFESPQQCRSDRVSASSPALAAFIVAMLIGVESSLSVILICISPLVRDAGIFAGAYLPVSVTGKYPFVSFAYVLAGFSFYTVEFGEFFTGDRD